MLHIVRKFYDYIYGLPQVNGQFKVELLRPWDLLQVKRLEADSFPEPLSFGALVRLWLKPQTTYLAVKDGRRLAAYIGFQALGPMAHTISMCVASTYRRQGLGKLVQKAANQVAVKQGLRWFCGEVRVSNTTQFKMLADLGWEQVGTCSNFFGNGEDGVFVLYWLESGQHD